MPVKRDFLQRNSNNNLFIFFLYVLDGNFRAFQGTVIKPVGINILLNPLRRINQSVAVHKGKFFQPVQFFHLSLECLQMFYIFQIVSFQQTYRRIQIVNIVFEIGSDDLFPSSRQLVKI